MLLSVSAAVISLSHGDSHAARLLPTTTIDGIASDDVSSGCHQTPRSSACPRHPLAHRRQFVHKRVGARQN
eukprot:6808480-Prymnesium_polylepis.1